MLKSAMVQGMVRPAVTMILVIGYTAMVALQHPVPEGFVSLVTMAVGFWYGSRGTSK